MTHKEYYLAVNHEDDWPEITDGPYANRVDAVQRLEDFSNKEDFIILSGDFPDDEQ